MLHSGTHFATRSAPHSLPRLAICLASHPGPRHPKTLQVPNTKTNLGDNQVVDPGALRSRPRSHIHSEAACLPHAFDTGGTSLSVSQSPCSPQPPQLRRRKRTPLSPHPHRPFFPARPALTCRSKGRGAPRGQARVPVVSGEDRAARGRPTEDPHLSRARRGLAAGERWQPAAVLLSAAARGGQARPSAPRRRRAPRSASRAAQPGGEREGDGNGGGAARGGALGGRAAGARRLWPAGPAGAARAQQPAPGRPLSSAAAAPGASHPRRPPAAPPPPGRVGEERERGGRARAWGRVRGGARAPPPPAPPRPGGGEALRELVVVNPGSALTEGALALQDV